MIKNEFRFATNVLSLVAVAQENRAQDAIK